MFYIAVNGATSQAFRVKLRNSSTGAGLTGLTSASSGLNISTICDNEASATAYTVAGSTIESITTLGTFAAPTATKCRFKEVDATNHPGLYELQLADARFAVSSARRLKVNFSGATSLLDKDITIQLTSVNVDSATAFMSSVATVTTVTNQLTGSQIATAVWQDMTSGDFTVSGSIGKSLFTSGAVPGANGGIFIAGTNAATTITTGLTTHFIGTLDTLTTYTGNTVQTGDAYARLGAAGAGLTALGDTRLANLDAAVSGRMATYTQPTGFLAATFPGGTIANTTNITAGTVTTTTNLTNAPMNGDFSATMKTSIATAVDPFFGDIDASIVTLQSTATSTNNIVSHGTYGNAAIAASIPAMPLGVPYLFEPFPYIDDLTSNGLLNVSGGKWTTPGFGVTPYVKNGAITNNGEAIDLRAKTTSTELPTDWLNVDFSFRMRVGTPQTGHHYFVLDVPSILNVIINFWNAGAGSADALANIHLDGPGGADDLYFSDANYDLKFSQNIWHTIGVSVKTIAGVSTVTIFIDGKPKVSGNMSLTAGPYSPNYLSIRINTADDPGTLNIEVDDIVFYRPPVLLGGTNTAITGTAIYNRIGAPAGASLAADVAAVKSDTGAIKTKTDSLTFTNALKLDAMMVDMSAAGAAKFFSVNSGTNYAAAQANSVVKQIADNASGGGGGGGITEQEKAELLAGPKQ